MSIKNSSKGIRSTCHKIPKELTASCKLDLQSPKAINHNLPQAMAKKAETVQTTNYYVIYDTLKTSWKMAEKLSLTFILL